jgi:hypothetical protein
MNRLVPGLAATSILALGACSDVAPPADDFGYEGTGIAVTVAPLDLNGVADACYSFEIRNGLGQRVVARGKAQDPGGVGVAGQGGDGGPAGLEGREATPLCSSRFGDGGGAINYVAPCDASSPAHTVTLWVNAVCQSGTLGGTGACVPMYGYQNPCGNSGCTVSTTCVEDSDVPVRFDFTIMASAKQGFFDIAVRFDEVFCSAKLDTCYEDGSTIKLLFDDSGNEASTAVAAIACTAGTEDLQTRLFHTTFKATCGGKTYGLPLAGVSLEGNTHLVELDATGAPVSGGTSINAAVYFGTEAIVNGPEKTDANKVFTNIAFVLPNDGKPCAIDWRVVPASAPACPASEDGSAGSFRQVAGVAFKGEVAQGGTCERYALDAANSAVQTEYLKTNGTAAYTSVLVEDTQAFAAAGCGSAPPIDHCSPNPCLNGTCASTADRFTCACAPGFEGPTCAVSTDECLGNPCLNGGTCTDGTNSFTCACTPGFEGPTCETVSATCNDGLQNQGEAGVDCGGPCDACSGPSLFVSLTTYSCFDLEGGVIASGGPLGGCGPAGDILWAQGEDVTLFWNEVEADVAVLSKGFDDVTLADVAGACFKDHLNDDSCVFPVQPNGGSLDWTALVRTGAGNVYKVGWINTSSTVTTRYAFLGSAP